MCEATSRRLEWIGGARPWPIFGTGDQTCGYGVSLNIGADFLPFLWGADPVVEGFVLPKSSAAAAEKLICGMRRRAFYLPGDARKRGSWFEQEVNVVGHHYVRLQFEQAWFFRSTQYF